MSYNAFSSHTWRSIVNRFDHLHVTRVVTRTCYHAKWHVHRGRYIRTLHPDAVWTRRKTERVARDFSRRDMNKRLTALLFRAIFLARRYRPITFRYRPSNRPRKAVINPLRALLIVFISFYLVEDGTLDEYTDCSEILRFLSSDRLFYQLEIDFWN